ncbi:MAG: type 4a pilus biogenesis protein PilO [Bdellovibrionota bacterium]
MLQRIALLSYMQVLLIALVLGAFWYYSVFDSGNALDAQIIALEQSFQKEQSDKKTTDDNLAKEKEMRDMVGLLGKQYQEVSQRLPSDLTSTELKRQLDQFAKAARVNIKSFEPTDEKMIQIVTEIPALLIVEGSYFQLAQFVDLISKSEKVMSVRNLSMEPVNPPVPGRLSMRTQVIGYEMFIEEKPATDKPGTASAPAGGQ